MKIKYTPRGFAYADFTDDYGDKCSIQHSSAATKACLWLGMDGPSTTALGKTRMHLTRGQVKKLLPLLQRFVDTGTIEEASE